MAIVINGSGTVTGITAGGLPDGCITADELASGVGGGGKLLQVVKNESTTVTSVASATFQATGLTGSITPTASSSKILIFVGQTFKHKYTRGHGIQVDRNGTVVYQDAVDYTNFNGATGDIYGRSTTWVEDTPSSTSSLTYTIKAYTASATQVDFQHSGTKSQIILMEIAG